MLFSQVPPPLSHAPPTAGFGSGGLEERPHRKGRRRERLRHRGGGGLESGMVANARNAHQRSCAAPVTSGRPRPLMASRPPQRTLPQITSTAVHSLWLAFNTRAASFISHRPFARAFCVLSSYIPNLDIPFVKGGAVVTSNNSQQSSVRTNRNRIWISVCANA